MISKKITGEKRPDDGGVSRRRGRKGSQDR